MHDFNSSNERIKHRYFRVLREARGQSRTTIDQTGRALLDFERTLGFAGFETFDEDKATAYKKDLRSRRNNRTKLPLSPSSVRSNLLAVQKFFRWYLEHLPRGVRIERDAVEFLNPSNVETALARTSIRPKTIPTREQLNKLFEVMPSSTIGERRDRATLAFLALTACRVGALLYVRIKHVDLEKNVLNLDAREIPTKFSKSFTTPFFPVGKRYKDELSQWIEELRTKEFLGPDDPLFPRLKVEATKSQGFISTGLTREFMKSTGTISKMVGDVFVKAGLPRTSPHRFRDMIGELIGKADLSIDEAKAFSMSLGHKNLSITLSSYAVPTMDQQRVIMDQVRKRLED
jgi:integrase